MATPSVASGRAFVLIMATFIICASPASAVDTDGDGLTDEFEAGSGMVTAWGDNSAGQCNVPAGMFNVIAVDAGDEHSVALLANGTVRCWGRTLQGRCQVPSGLNDVVAVSAGITHTLALRSNGTVVSWGGGTWAAVPAWLSDVVSISAGCYTSVAVRDDGSVVRWGYGLTAGVLPGSVDSPCIASGGNGMSKATLGILNGAIVVWGNCIPPTAASPFTEVAVGDFHFAAVRADGVAHSWQDGNTFVYAPTGAWLTPPGGIPNVVSASVDATRTILLAADHRSVIGLGDNWFRTCISPPGITNISSISAGYFHNVALTRLDPTDPDTDGDGFWDGDEIDYGTSPVMRDTDQDGMDDLDEGIAGMDPLVYDANFDGLPDGWQALQGINGEMFDVDADDLYEFDEWALGTDPFGWDSDGDEMPDGWEMYSGLNPMSAEGVNGAEGDLDGDGLSNLAEMEHGVEPAYADTDGDGVSDGVEVLQGSNPASPSDLGLPPPAADLVSIPFKVEDPSGSNSEMWRMRIRGLGPTDTRVFSFCNPSTGAWGNQPPRMFLLRKGNRYEMKLEHVRTIFEDHPDYDWQATIGDNMPCTLVLPSDTQHTSVNRYVALPSYSAIVDNLDGLLGQVDQGFFAVNHTVGKTAILYVVKVTTTASDLSAEPDLDAWITDVGGLLGIRGGVRWSATVQVTPLEAKPHVDVRLVQAIKGAMRRIYRTAPPATTGSKTDTGEVWHFDGAHNEEDWEDVGSFFQIVNGDTPQLLDSASQWSSLEMELDFEVSIQYRITSGSWLTMQKGAWSTSGLGVATFDGQGGYIPDGGVHNAVTSEFAPSPAAAVETPRWADLDWEDYQ